MENDQIFTYRYSARQNQEVENIRKKYLPQEVSKINQLRQLDRRVQTAGLMQSLTVGIIGCLIFGLGMCFGLNVFGGGAVFATFLCPLGLAVMLPAYPLFRHISKKTKEKLTPQILKLTDEILQ